uniref:Reverse transcriptase domain-containing protein n=1 Tax=Tanacetum cinerariifolium TaxID=118510 RepID=A0A6L2J2J1_TANCI|nr:reverse transcriptase domain-containing protein [Tanacetum cinerariifolium]
MHTRSSCNLPVVSPSNPLTSNPKRRNRRRSKQPVILEESPIDTMADQRTMAELLRARTEGYAEAILVPPILVEQFELKHSLINMMTTDQFFELEKDNPHDHIRWGSPPAWDRYKDLLRACPHHGFTELYQLDTFYNALNPADQDSLNADAGGNLLERRTQDVLTIIEKNLRTAILKQFQATPPPASVKAVEETCVTCGGAHPYYQCLAAGGNTFPKLRDNIQGYVSAAAINYNQGSLPSNTVANLKGKLKDITTRGGIVLDGPTVPTPPPFINPEEDGRVEETLTDPNLSEYTIKVPPPPIQKYKPPSQREYVVHQRVPVHPNIPYPSRMLKQKQQEKYEVQIQKFWQMFKQLHINITLTDALILMPKYQKMLKALLSNKEKLQELTNTPLNENCSAVILKKLPEKLVNPGKFLIPCGFSELKCKALADLAGIARDVFVPVGKFTFQSNFIIVDYESDPRVPLILGRPFLRTARALIDVHGEEMTLRDGDERLTINMRHDTSSYSNQPQKESINLINVFNNSKGGNVLPEKLLDLDSTKDLHPSLYSQGFIYQSNLANPADNFVDFMLEMFIDEHAVNYSSPPIFDEYDDDFLEAESDTDNVYDDPFNSKGEKLKESKLLIDELDLPCDFLLPSEYDSLSLRIFLGLMLSPQPTTRTSIPRNLKTHAKEFCPSVFISSASLRNHEKDTIKTGQIEAK